MTRRTMNDTPVTNDKPALYNLSQDELIELLSTWGEKSFRARQIYRQLYINVVDDIGLMTDLSKSLRERLEQETDLFTLKKMGMQVGDRGLTRKVLFALPDGSPVESVLMVYADRATVCVSSQSGCPMDCSFCATGKLGFLHDLTAGHVLTRQDVDFATPAPGENEFAPKDVDGILGRELQRELKQGEAVSRDAVGGDIEGPAPWFSPRPPKHKPDG